jgi:hypothetical protein
MNNYCLNKKIPKLVYNQYGCAYVLNQLFTNHEKEVYGIYPDPPIMKKKPILKINKKLVYRFMTKIAMDIAKLEYEDFKNYLIDNELEQYILCFDNNQFNPNYNYIIAIFNRKDNKNISCDANMTLLNVLNNTLMNTFVSSPNSDPDKLNDFNVLSFSTFTPYLSNDNKWIFGKSFLYDYNKEISDTYIIYLINNYNYNDFSVPQENSLLIKQSFSNGDEIFATNGITPDKPVDKPGDNSTGATLINNIYSIFTVNEFRSEDPTMNNYVDFYKTEKGGAVLTYIKDSNDSKYFPTIKNIYKNNGNREDIIINDKDKTLIIWPYIFLKNNKKVDNSSDFIDFKLSIDIFNYSNIYSEINTDENETNINSIYNWDDNIFNNDDGTTNTTSIFTNKLIYTNKKTNVEYLRDHYIYCYDASDSITDAKNNSGFYIDNNSDYSWTNYKDKTLNNLIETLNDNILIDQRFMVIVSLWTNDSNKEDKINTITYNNIYLEDSNIIIKNFVPTFINVFDLPYVLLVNTIWNTYNIYNNYIEYNGIQYPINSPNNFGTKKKIDCDLNQTIDIKNFFSLDDVYNDYNLNCYFAFFLTSIFINGVAAKTLFNTNKSILYPYINNETNDILYNISTETNVKNIINNNKNDKQYNTINNKVIVENISTIIKNNSLKPLYILNSSNNALNKSIPMLNKFPWFKNKNSNEIYYGTIAQIMDFDFLGTTNNNTDTKPIIANGCDKKNYIFIDNTYTILNINPNLKFWNYIAIKSLLKNLFNLSDETPFNQDDYEYC